MFKHATFIAAIVVLSGCATFQQDTTTAYTRAVDDAAVAESNEISDRLFAINSANEALR